MNDRVMEDMRGDRKFALALILLYSAIAFVYLVLPVADRFNGVLIGSKLLPIDSLLGSGILEWGFRSIWSSKLHFFDWNAGYPVANSLAITENLVGWQLLYSPLRWLGVDVPAAYNIVLLTSLVISGVGAAMLSRELGAERWGATFAGFVFAFAPFHLANIMNLQTMAVCWVPFVLLFLDRFLAFRRTSDGVWMAALLSVVLLSGIYIAVFLGISIVVYVALTWLVRRHAVDRRSLTGLGVILLAAAVVVSPVLYHYVRFFADNGVYRASVQNVEALSMEWTAPLRTPTFQSMWSSTPLATVLWNGEPAFLGAVASILLLAGIWISRRDATARRSVLLLIGLSLVAYLLALGPYLKTVGPGPPKIVWWLPMPGRIWLWFPGIRWPSRIFFIALLCEAVLAGIGLSLLRQLLAPRWRKLIGGTALGLCAIEFAPASWLSGDSVKVKTPMAMSDSYPVLSVESDSGAVVELPEMSAPGFGHDLSGVYIYGASGHLRKIAAAHGGRPLPRADSLLHIAELLPSDDARLELSRRGVSRVVVHRLSGDTATNERFIRSLEGAGYPAIFDGRESVVFKLTR